MLRILKRRSPEEEFAEQLAKELERQAKEMEKSLTPEARERLRLMDKNSEAWKLAEERIGRGEIKLFWRKISDNLYIVARETFRNFHSSATETISYCLAGLMVICTFTHR